MSTFALICHPSAETHDPGLEVPGHPDAPQRIQRCEAVLREGEGEQIEPLRWIQAPPVTDAELARVHAATYLDRLVALSAAGGGRLDDETVLGPGSLTAARHAAGGACQLVRELIGRPSARGMCLSRPAGHHAEPDQALGFCLLNNVAIAAEAALADGGLDRVMIIDWDVHHGNGTVEAFRHRRDVLVANIHQTGLFPPGGGLADAGSGEGRGYTINVPVPPGSDEEVWVSVLEHLILPIGLEYRPQLILVSAGYDAHRDDPLAQCELETGSYAQLACHVRDLAEAVGAPLGAVLEGGYDPDALADSVLATVGAWQGRGHAESIAPEPLITPRAAGQFAAMWSL